MINFVEDDLMKMRKYLKEIEGQGNQEEKCLNLFYNQSKNYFIFTDTLFNRLIDVDDL